MNQLLLITALSLSAIAAWYAIAGLVAIFAAAVIPIMIMGGALEVSKLVLASWIYRNWKEIPLLMKSYLTSALIVLMMLTSMGIFGYLSKAHLDQAVPTGDVAAKVQIIDDKIKIEQDMIAQARKDLAQMNTQIDKYNELDAVSKGVRVREQQKKERETLLKQIETAQAKVTKLREERAPIAAELRKVEAEVGPIKYVAALIYGDNPDQNLLEKAVRVVIIMIVIVFDPLAVIMLIAANWSLARKTIEVQDLPQPPKEEKPEVAEEAPPKQKKPKKREWLEPDSQTLNLNLSETVSVDDSLDFEQRGWTSTKKGRVPKKTKDFLQKAEWIAKSTKIEKEKKSSRPVYEEFTISSDIDETK